MSDAKCAYCGEALGIDNVAFGGRTRIVCPRDMSDEFSRLRAVMEGQEALRAQTVRIREAAGAEPDDERDTEEIVARLRADLDRVTRERDAIKETLAGISSTACDAMRALLSDYRELESRTTAATTAEERRNMKTSESQLEILRILAEYGESESGELWSHHSSYNNIHSALGMRNFGRSLDSLHQRGLVDVENGCYAITDAGRGALAGGKP